MRFVTKKKQLIEEKEKLKYEKKLEEKWPLGKKQTAENTVHLQKQLPALHV